MLCQIAHKSEAVLEIVIAPYENENAAIDALLERVLDETTCPISWWTRAPRHQDAGELGAKYGGTAHRSVLRMERALDAAIESDVKSRAFVDEDAGEVIRINNEAFSGHPDRSQLTEDDVYEKLRVQGNRYEDLRMTNGAFCWTKRHSINESEIFVLAVDNEHRHLGLGGNLLRSTLEFIRTEHHVPLVSLYVEHDNTKAIALYKQNGFADTEKTLHSVVFPAR
jgi:mycothiol synthase